MNPALERLGFGPTDRVVVLHIDDLGVAPSSLDAFSSLQQRGVRASGSVMVPTPWFPDVARLCRQVSELDIGVHVTMTSEFHAYRWRPISTLDRSTGLIDHSGYFFSSIEQLSEHASVDAIGCEMEAQIVAVESAGLTPSHVDWHMIFVDVRYEVLERCVEIALRHGLLPLVLRGDADVWAARIETGSSDAQRADVEGLVALAHRLEGRGVPLFDAFEMAPLVGASTHDERLERQLDQLQPGLTHLCFHPAADCPGTRAFAPDWRCRDADYRFLTSSEIERVVRTTGVHLTTYRHLRQLMS